jgi:hypothetical protein
MQKILFTGVIFLLAYFYVQSQDLQWTGKAMNLDFFDEANWEDPNTEIAPIAGTLEPQSPVNMHLLIEDAANNIISQDVIDLGSGSITLVNAELVAPAISSGRVTIGYDAYLSLTDNNPVSENTIVDFLSGIGWLKLSAVEPGEVLNQLLSQFLAKGQAAVYQNNLRIDNYYHLGSLVRLNDTDTQPIKIYSMPFSGGFSHNLLVNEFYQGDGLPGQMNNNIQSFVLKRGFMATLAINEDGTGLSKVFIASEEDLVINEMPEILSHLTSFIRVIPWNWVAKKGIGGNVTGLNETWHYNWGLTGNSSINREIGPMAWGYNGASPESVEILKNKYKATHVMGFNESDNCNDQSGQYFDLCQTDVAVPRYRNLMKTGLRMVSPATREGGALTWLKDFHTKATAMDIRIDVIAVHWYDWGGNPANTPNANPEQVFNRFKNYLTNVYNYYKLPIWITEFNANPNRNTPVQEGFMELAIPYLESLHYVERYAWFQPFSGTGDYYDGSSNYTNVGSFYRDFVSTPTVDEATLLSPSNLDGKVPDVTSVSHFPSHNDFIIYPNPVSGLLFIKNASELNEAEIFDISGSRVARRQINSSTIDVSSLSRGIYLVRIGNVNKRFIKL